MCEKPENAVKTSITRREGLTILKADFGDGRKRVFIKDDRPPKPAPTEPAASTIFPAEFVI